METTLNTRLKMSGLVGYGSSDEEGGNGDADIAKVKVPPSSLTFYTCHLILRKQTPVLKSASVDILRFSHK